MSPTSLPKRAASRQSGGSLLKGVFTYTLVTLFVLGLLLLLNSGIQYLFALVKSILEAAR